MHNALGPVFDFLARTGVEVEGRTVQEPPPVEMQERLRALALGRLSGEELTEVCDLLRSRPGWLHWAAELVKSERSRKEDAAQDS